MSYRGGGGRGAGRGGGRGGGFNWQKFVQPSSDERVIGRVEDAVKAFIQSGEQRKKVLVEGYADRNTYRDMTAKLGCGWEKDPNKERNVYWLVRWFANSEEAAATKKLSLTEKARETENMIREKVMAKGGKCKFKDIMPRGSPALSKLQAMWGAHNIMKAFRDTGVEFQFLGYDKKFVFVKGLDPNAVLVTGVDARRLEAVTNAIERNIKLDNERGAGNKAGGESDPRYMDGGMFRPIDESKQPTDRPLEEHRRRLPVWKERDSIAEKISKSQVTIVIGATGCGKTTQVPQFVLDWLMKRGQSQNIRIVCTQPRRISAVSVAERVAAERGVKCGGSVGYQVRFDAVASPTSTQLFFCTVGILLRHLRGDPNLSHVSHIVVDEVHERDVHADFLLIVLARLLKRRPELKVILMSATVDPSKFIDYFGGPNKVATIEVPGKTNFPIEELFLEDILCKKEVDPLTLRNAQQRYAQDKPFGGGGGKGKDKYLQFMQANIEPPSINTISRFIAQRTDAQTAQIIAQLVDAHHQKPVIDIDFPLVANVVESIHRGRDEGAVLVFLTGWFEIAEVVKLLKKQSCASEYEIFPLHGMMPTAEQKRIFLPPPDGKRKVILATNIAETSITVEDVVYVVDAGKIKQTTYDSQVGIATLTTVTAPKANGQQRRGRAGRCRPGVWYRLYSSWQWNDATPDSSVPEMLRTPMEELVLHVKSLELDFNKDRKCYDVAAVLREAIDPPEHQAVLRALRTLRNISAIDPRPPNAGGTEALTPLGSKLADMPMHPVLGKLVLYGALFGVLDPILTIAASLGYKSPFYLPMGEEAEANAAKAALAGRDTQLRSDHLLVVRAFDEWRSMPKGSRQQYSWCRKHYISQTTMTYIDSIREDIKRVVKDFRIDSFGVRADVTRSTISDSDDDYDIERIGLEEHSGKGKGGNGNDRRNHHQATDLTRIHQVVEAVLCSGLSPARVLSEKREPQLIVAETGRADAAVPHPGSLLGGPPPRRGEEEKRIGLTPHDHFVVYFTLQRTTKLFCYDCTAVPVLAMVLFAATADPIPPPSSDAEVTCLQLSKPLPLHLVQFQRAATCAQVLRLRELIHQRFLPAVIGRPLRPEHREAVLSLVDLLYKADETLQCASEDDDDDDDDDDGVKSSTSSAPKTQPSSVDGHFFSSTQNGGAGDRDGHGWSRGGSGSGTGGRGGGYRGRGGGYGGRGRDGRGGRGGNIH